MARNEKGGNMPKWRRVAEGIYTREGSKYLQIRFPYAGKQIRKSSHTTSLRDAQRKRRKLIEAYESGRQVGNADRIKVSDLKALGEVDYDVNKRRSKDRMLQHWAHLDRFFPPDSRAMSINPLSIDRYTQARLAEGAAPQTIRNELSTLRRSF